MADDAAGAVVLGVLGVAAVGATVGIVGLLSDVIRPRERLQGRIEELRDRPLFPNIRLVQRAADLVDPKAVTALEAVIGRGDPRVQVERFQGVCDRATVREKEGVTPSGHTGDIVTGLRCVIDYEERRRGGQIRL